MSTLKSDTTQSHYKNLGQRVGTFCGSPIIELYQHEVELDQYVETNRLVEIGRENPPSVIEILPGEVISNDGIVRRSTAAEVVGDEFYEYQLPSDARKVTLAEARRLSDSEGSLVTWRPNRVCNAATEFATVHEGTA